MKRKIDKESVLIGSDFEMFLRNKEGKIISAIPFNSGTKAEPEKLSKKGCCIQRDGVLQECNVPPVKLDQGSTFAKNVEFVKGFIMGSFGSKNDLELVCCASAELEDDQLLDPEAHEIGCDPDFNAWDNGNINEKPASFASGLRSCGGHIHFSYPNADTLISMDLMKCFDLHLTVPFLLIDPDERRRQLYGKAGAFRICDWGKAAGFEARTLSNYWLSSKETILYVFKQLNQMFDYYNTKGMKEINKDNEHIINAINNSNIELALQLCEKYDVNVIRKLNLV